MRAAYVLFILATATALVGQEPAPKPKPDKTEKPDKANPRSSDKKAAAGKTPKSASWDLQGLWRSLSGVKVSGDPDAARLITTDIDNFWRAYDKATPKDLAQVLERDYFKPGTPGLQDFIRLRLRKADNLAKTIAVRPKYYASIRATTLRAGTMEKRIRACFYALKHLYPEAVFPDVYFLIGQMSTGGTTSARGLLIGMEMYSRTPKASEAEMSDWHKQVLVGIDSLPAIVAHELIHYQQNHPVRLKSTLLSQSIIEGGADFLGELISGSNTNERLHAYGNAAEKRLWQEFRAEMGGSKFTRWLYNGADIKDRPADLGYYVGYKIVEAHYQQAKDKKRAIKEILTIQDFPKFLKDSGYEAMVEKRQRKSGARQPADKNAFELRSMTALRLITATLPR